MRKNRWKFTKRCWYFENNVKVGDKIEVKISDYLGVYTVTGKITYINDKRTMIIVKDEQNEEFDMLRKEIIYLHKLD